MRPDIDRPSREAIGRIAENQPGLLSLLVAYFVLEWQEVRIGNPPHGIDQCGEAAIVPDYVYMWGLDACVHYLLRSPVHRGADDPGFISAWLEEVSA